MPRGEPSKGTPKDKRLKDEQAVMTPVPDSDREWILPYSAGGMLPRRAIPPTPPKDYVPELVRTHDGPGILQDGSMPERMRS